MHAPMPNVKNIRKHIENFTNILEKNLFEKEVFQRYFSIFFFLLGTVIPRNMRLFLIKHDLASSK